MSVVKEALLKKKCTDVKFALLRHRGMFVLKGTTGLTLVRNHTSVLIAILHVLGALVSKDT